MAILQGTLPLNKLAKACAFTKVNGLMYDLILQDKKKYPIKTSLTFSCPSFESHNIETMTITLV